MLNHFCFILLELWVCGLGRASPPRPGSFPVKEPSSVTFNGKRKLKGLKGPAASYKRQKKAAFCSFLFTSQKQQGMTQLQYYLWTKWQTIRSKLQTKQPLSAEQGMAIRYKYKPGQKGQWIAACFVTTSKLFPLRTISQKNYRYHQYLSNCR